MASPPYSSQYSYPPPPGTFDSIVSADLNSSLVHGSFETSSPLNVNRATSAPPAKSRFASIPGRTSTVAPAAPPPLPSTHQRPTTLPVSPYSLPAPPGVSQSLLQQTSPPSAPPLQAPQYYQPPYPAQSAPPVSGLTPQQLYSSPSAPLSYPGPDYQSYDSIGDYDSKPAGVEHSSADYGYSYSSPAGPPPQAPGTYPGVSFQSGGPETAVPGLSGTLPSTLSNDQTYPQTYTQSYQQTYSQEPATGSAPEPSAGATASGDALAKVSVQDGDEPQSITSPRALASYLRMFPEADNDQSCRIFKYGPRCSTELLMSLFEHFDFPRFSVFPYGFVGDFGIADHWGAGSCKCDPCLDGRLCGHYVLQKNLQFHLYQDVTPATSRTPKITTTPDEMIISTGISQYRFSKATWNLQFFRFRSRKLQTSVFAFDALIYQNFESEIKLKSSPLDYVFTQLESVLSNWESVLNASSQFLSVFRVEVLEERLETDRSIVRNLLVAAQQWEGFRVMLQDQLKRLDFMKNVHSDPRWTEGRDNYEVMSAVARGYVQKFEAIDFRITTELMQETDNLVQRVTNLISIDEGYRSRDQNESIRRLTWITFIFLPLVFTASLFSMQIDIFDVSTEWQNYIYTSLVLMFLVLCGYAALRYRKKLRTILAFAAMVCAMPVVFPYIIWTTWREVRRENQGKTRSIDVENQETTASLESATVLKWAASSGRTEVVHSILRNSNQKSKLTPGMSGQALLLAVQNGHVEAATLLINNREGLYYSDESRATALHWAARMGMASTCQQLLDKGASLSAKDQDDQTALDWAMKGSDEATINILLKGGKNFTRQETANLQSLHFSARTGDIDVIKEFHRQGSSLEARDSKGQTVLFHAVKGKRHEIVKWLLKDGRANVQAVDKEGLTPLHVAAQVCDMKSAEILLDHKAEVNALSSRNLTPLHLVLHPEGVRLLIFLHEKGAEMEASDKSGDRITHKIASKGDAAAVLFKIASDRGADLDSIGAQGNHPSHLAAESGSCDILRILYGKDIDLSKPRNKLGFTPLMMAARSRKVAAMRFLLDNGSSYNVVDAEGRSLMELTIGWGNAAVMSVLQAYGADYSNVTLAGDTVHPVWKAVYEGQAASVAKILDGGLSVEYEHRGVRILQLAIEAQNEEVVRLLLDRGAAIDVPDIRGWTALHSAAYAGNAQLLLLLLQKMESTSPININTDGTANANTKPDINVKDHQGWTPLDLAAFYKYDEVIKVLDPEGKVTEFAWMKVGRIRLMATSYHVPVMVDSAVPGVAETG